MFSPPAQPTFAPKGQTFAFTDDRGVLLAQAPQWKPRVVLGHGLFPSWAPDARRLVVANGPRIEVLDTVTHRTRAVGPGDFAVWSHNGKLIACVTAGGQLWAMDPAGKHRTKLATRAHIDSIAWSPGDDRIAFSSSIGDSSTTSWAVSASAGQPIKLGSGAFPDWSPDGTALSVEGHDGYLYLVRADGSGRHRLTKGFGAAWAPSP